MEISQSTTRYLFRFVMSSTEGGHITLIWQKCWISYNCCRNHI